MSYFTFLRTFVTVYRCGSYNKASKTLGLSQPAISKQICSLEHQMGKKLFKRNGRGLEATVIADELANSLAYHVDAIELIFNQSRTVTNEVAGTIHIGGPKEFINAKMIPIFASLSQHSIKTVLQINSPDKIYKMMDDGTLDLAITERVLEKSNIGYCNLFVDELVLVVAPEWAEKIKDEMSSPSMLSDIPLLVYEEAFSYIQQYYVEVFKENNVKRPVITVADLSIIHNLLCEGAGYSVLPRYLVKESLASGKLVQLLMPKPPPKYTLYLLWNKFSVRKPRNLLTRDAILQESEIW